MRQEIVAGLEERFGGDCRFEYYPESDRALREIKMGLRSWREASLPLTFMVRSDADGRPSVRVLIWRESFRKRAEGLAAWARGVNASLGPGAAPLVDEGFPRIRGWDWHKVLPEEDYPASAELSGDGFDVETAREAVGAVVALVELLRPHVERTWGRA